MFVTANLKWITKADFLEKGSTMDEQEKIQCAKKEKRERKWKMYMPTPVLYIQPQK